MRTYSRLGLTLTDGGERPSKRRRIVQDSWPLTCAGAEGDSSDNNHSSSNIASESSSGLEPAVQQRSDELDEPSSTPPSSPPPTAGPASSRSNSSITLEKAVQRVSTQYGAQITGSGRSLVEASESRVNHGPVKRKRAQKYTQLQLDLGQKVRHRCKTCGMEYAPSVAEDAAVHKQFHAMSVGGAEMGKAFVESDACQQRTVWQGGGGQRIVECGARDSRLLKNKVRAVLDVVDTELGAVKIEDSRLWASADKDPQTVLFKSYLYLKHSRCVGLCLVEDLKLAYKVLPAEGEQTGGPGLPLYRGPLRMADKPDAVMKGITRVWTSQHYRKEGIATRLLDCAQKHAVYGRELPKKYIAFSQPTEGGTMLARKWYGHDAGWHVYTG